MATTIYPTVRVAQPEAELWPVDNDPIGIQADEMLARQLDTGFAGEIRNLVHDPETGFAGRDPEGTLGGVAEAMPMLGELKDRYLAQAIGPRQRSILEPLIDSRLDRAAGDLGRIAQQATSALDDRIVAERIADLQQDAALAWHDPAHLRALGRTAVGELRYQGERRGWDETQTNKVVLQGLSDLYAGAVESAIGQDPERAAKLYEHARDVIQPDRQTVVERKMERARDEHRVAEVLDGVADASDDPTRRPDLDDYQVRAAGLTPSDASPEVRAQVHRMAAIEYAQANRAWQAARGRAAVTALDWLTKNPAARLLAMPPELRDGLSPEQTEALGAAVINGGRVRTVTDLYGNLMHQAVTDPEGFASIQLDQHRLALSDVDYTRLSQWQRAIEAGQRDDTLVQLGRASRRADSALRQRGYDLEGSETKEVRADIHHEVLEFDTLDGRPANRDDVDRIVNRIVEPLISRQTVTADVGPPPSNSESETAMVAASAQQIAPIDAKANESKLDSEVTNWLMKDGSDGQRQMERPPLSVWNQLTDSQRGALDFLLARNVADASAQVQLAGNLPDAANENTRNYVCTQAVYSCLSNTPPNATLDWHARCLQHESMCNQLVNQSRVSPFPKGFSIIFPDRSYVTVPEGSRGGGQFTPPP